MLILRIAISRHMAKHHPIEHNLSGRRVDYSRCLAICRQAAVDLAGAAAVRKAEVKDRTKSEAPFSNELRIDDNWTPAAAIAATAAAAANIWVVLAPMPPAPAPPAPGPPATAASTEELAVKMEDEEEVAVKVEDEEEAENEGRSD